MLYFQALFYYDPPENPPLCGFEDVPLMQIQSKDVSPYLTLVITKKYLLQNQFCAYNMKMNLCIQE